MYSGIIPVVDRGFLKKLKRIDPGLDCEFDRKFGKFVIYQTGKISGRVPLAVIEGNEGGGYRYPDNRDIILIHEADMYYKGQELKDRVRRGEESMLAAKREEERKIREEIRDVTKDDKIQLMRSYHQTFNMGGKGNASFRRVTPKPKRGYIVRDNRVVKVNNNL